MRIFFCANHITTLANKLFKVFYVECLGFRSMINWNVLWIDRGATCICFAVLDLDCVCMRVEHWLLIDRELRVARGAREVLAAVLKPVFHCLNHGTGVTWIVFDSRLA